MTSEMTQIAHNGKRRGRWLPRILLGITALVVLLGGIWFALVQAGYIPSPIIKNPLPMPTQADTRDARWQQDIDYLVANLAYLHANAFFQVSRETFEAQAARLKADVPTLDDAAIQTEIAALTALIGDGHTTADVHGNHGLQVFPFRSAWYGDKLVVGFTHPDYTDLLGTQVTRIGDTDIQTATTALERLIAHDTATQILTKSPLWLRTPAALHALGILESADNGTYTFETVDGQSLTRRLTPIDIDDSSFEWVSMADRLNIEQPLWQQNTDQNYWYTYLEDSQTIYFAYNVCGDHPAKSFADFTREFMAFIDAKPVTRMIVDLRNNGGGNSSVINPFLDEVKARPNLNTPETLAVLIGRRTFSSAMLNAIDFDTQTNATLYGEATGGKPNSYGEVRTFDLPNSGITVQYSTFFFNIIPGFEGDAVLPDVPVTVTWADFLAGKDPVLEAVMGNTG